MCVDMPYFVFYSPYLCIFCHWTRSNTIFALLEILLISCVSIYPHSLFAQVSNVLALAVVFWFDFSHSEEVPFTPTEYSLQGFPFFFAVSIYCYEVSVIVNFILCFYVSCLASTEYHRGGSGVPG